MSKTIRQQIVEAVRDRFKTILTSGGYQTSLGSNLTIWNTTPIQKRELEGIDLRDTSDKYDEKITRHVEHRLRIDAEFHCKKEDATAAYLRNGIADINRAIGMDSKWSGLALSTHILADEMIIDKTDKTIGGVQVQIEIEYRTARYNQFSPTP